MNDVTYFVEKLHYLHIGGEEMESIKRVLHYCNVSLCSSGKIAASEIAYFDFTFVTKGSMVYIINGEPHVLEENDAIFLPPGTLRERNPIEAPVSFVSFNFLAGEGVDYPFPILMKNIISRDMIKLASVFPKTHMNPRDNSGEKLSYLLGYMLCELKDRLSLETNNVHIEKSLQYIEDNISKAVSLSSVSKHLNFSKGYLAVIFKKEMGMTVSEYIAERKMALAKDMILYSSMPLSEISESLGYENYSYFSRSFRKRYEISPSKYKTQFRTVK